jgi:hypothetical protein
VVPPRRWVRRTVALALHNSSWVKDLIGSLTVSILIQYLSLRQQTDNMISEVDAPDRWVWKWNHSGEYSSSSAYQSMFLGQAGDPWCQRSLE